MLIKSVTPRLIIRPTDDAINDEFWVAIAGSDIDWQKLSTSPEHFIEGVRRLSGLNSLEAYEMMTLNYYRYVEAYRAITGAKSGLIFQHQHSDDGFIRERSSFHSWWCVNPTFLSLCLFV